MKQRTLIVIAIGLALAAAALVWALRPRALDVELHTVARADFERVVEDEGRTRVRDRFSLTAPVAGRIERPALRVGDRVTAGQSLLRLRPQDPALLDRRTVSSLREKAGAAEAALHRSQAEFSRTQTAEALARSELERARELAGRGFISSAALESAQLALREKEQARVAASEAEELAGFELNAARVALQQAFGPGNESAGVKPAPRQEEVWILRSPVAGWVLKLPQESETFVTAGTLLVEIGDLEALEVVVEVLTQELTTIEPGMPARLSLSSTAPPEAGRVRRIEPVARTRVSALGIDEQRVSVLIDFSSRLAVRPGDGWRVETAIITLMREDVIVLPIGAMMRDDQGWAVFVEQGGRARLRRVELSGRNPKWAWIERGVDPGERIVVHPPDALVDGGAIHPRASR